MSDLPNTVLNVSKEKLKTQMNQVHVFVKTVHMKTKMVNVNHVVTNVLHVLLMKFVKLVLVLEKTTQVPMK